VFRARPTGEIAGSSDGEPNQLFKFQHDNVLDGEDIRVREVLSVEEREEIVREGGRDRIVDREEPRRYVGFVGWKTLDRCSTRVRRTGPR
jgi:hypothetical protein